MFRENENLRHFRMINSPMSYWIRRRNRRQLIFTFACLVLLLICGSNIGWSQSPSTPEVAQLKKTPVNDLDESSNSEDRDRSRWGIYGQMYDKSGRKVGGEFRADFDQWEYPSTPSVSGLSNGGFVVVWNGTGPQKEFIRGIYGQQFSQSGAKVGSEFKISIHRLDIESSPCVVGLSHGGFVAAWQGLGGDGRTLGIYAQRFDVVGKKTGGEFYVNTYPQAQLGPTCIVALSNGGFTVVWEGARQDRSGLRIYGQVYDSSGNKVGPEFQADTSVTYEKSNPAVASLAGGGFVVTWTSILQDGSETGIYGQRFDAKGNKLGGEFPANSFTRGYQFHPSVTALSDGGFIVAWEGLGKVGSGIFGQRYDRNGNKVGQEFLLPATARGQMWGSLAGLSGGGFVAKWTYFYRKDETNEWRVYGQRFDSMGKSIGPEFPIFMGPKGASLIVSITNLAGGGFVVVGYNGPIPEP